MIHSLPDKPMSSSWAEGDETCLVTISIKVEKYIRAAFLEGIFLRKGSSWHLLRKAGFDGIPGMQRV